MGLISLMFWVCPIALQVGTLFTQLALAVFMGALGVATIVILIAPFFGWFRHSKNNEKDWEQEDDQQISDYQEKKEISNINPSDNQANVAPLPSEYDEDTR